MLQVIALSSEATPPFYTSYTGDTVLCIIQLGAWFLKSTLFFFVVLKEKIMSCRDESRYQRCHATGNSAVTSCWRGTALRQAKCNSLAIRDRIRPRNLLMHNLERHCVSLPSQISDISFAHFLPTVAYSSSFPQINLSSSQHHWQ